VTPRPRRRRSELRCQCAAASSLCATCCLHATHPVLIVQRVAAPPAAAGAGDGDDDNDDDGSVRARGGALFGELEAAAAAGSGAAAADSAGRPDEVLFSAAADDGDALLTGDVENELAALQRGGADEAACDLLHAPDVPAEDAGPAPGSPCPWGMGDFEDYGADASAMVCE